MLSNSIVMPYNTLLQHDSMVSVMRVMVIAAIKMLPLVIRSEVVRTMMTMLLLLLLLLLLMMMMMMMQMIVEE
jgi:hypothetical protein